MSKKLNYIELKLAYTDYAHLEIRLALNDKNREASLEHIAGLVQAEMEPIEYKKLDGVDGYIGEDIPHD